MLSAHRHIQAVTTWRETPLSFKWSQAEKLKKFYNRGFVNEETAYWNVEKNDESEGVGRKSSEDESVFPLKQETTVGGESEAVH